MSDTKFNKNLIRSIILGVAALLAGILISKLMGKKDAQSDVKISFRSKMVAVQPFQSGQIPLTIAVTGRLKASERMELFADVGGVLQNRNFKAGNKFTSGSIIASIDKSEFAAQLKAQKSTFMGLVSQSLPDLAMDYPQDYTKWKNFLGSIEPTAPLPPLPSFDNQSVKQFLAGRNIISTYYQIQSLQERLRKYNIIAPYSGVLTEATIDPGTLVRIGQKLGTYVKTGGYELEVAVSKNDLKFLKVGNKVTLHSEELNKDYIGTVSRINDIVNPATQQISVFLSVNGAELREGIYLAATINGGLASKSMIVNRKLFIDGNALYTVMPDSTLHLQPIEVLNFSEEKAVITGVPENTWITIEPVSGAFEGMKVVPTLTESK
jgi:multidrug efflux pump subunit AcrA (membrane-fusion protein)